MKKNFLLLAISLGIILFVLLLLELFIQNKQPPKEITVFDLELWTHDGKKISKGNGRLKLITDPFTGFKNMPNQQSDWFHINSHGFRGKEIKDRANVKKRIIIVGGSAAFGTGVHSDNETFQSMLELFNPSYEVINAGVPGFLSGQELTYIVSELVDYQPDIIIAYDGFNDLDSQWHHETFFGRQKNIKELGYNGNFYFLQIEKALFDNYRTETEIVYSFNRFLKTLYNRSSVVKILKQKYEELLGQQPPSAKEKKEGTQRNGYKANYFQEILNNYTNNLLKMNDFCRCRNITFIVVFQPELGNKKVKTSHEQMMLKLWHFGTTQYAQEFPTLYARFLANAGQTMERHAVRYIDINNYAEFVENRETLFCDVVHTNQKGNEVIAGIINQSLKQFENTKNKKVP